MVKLSSSRYAILIAIILIMNLVTSCSTTKKRKDGPPKFYVDETRIPNATPKPEPLAKYGNMPFYHVFGQRYYVMKNFKNYHEVGTASWYGSLFHNRKTSSGERYDMLGMTAAHRTLPLPTYVEVRNLKNNRRVIVKVNDRGPFASDRIIDLSYVAAKKLDMIGHGTTRVEVRAIDPYTYGKPTMFARRRFASYQKFTQNVRQTQVAVNARMHRVQQRFGATTHTMTTSKVVQTKQYQVVYLQVGAFRNKNRAFQLKTRLANFLTAPIKVTYPSAAVKFYRVQVGPLTDSASINVITQKLQSIGIKPNKTHGV